MTPQEAVNTYALGIKGKLSQRSSIVFVKALFAGAMIAIGASASSVAAHAISNVGIARLVAGLVFPVGLMMVILLGAELFTGDCMLLIGALDKRSRLLQIAKFLGVVFVGNLIGAVGFSLLLSLSGQLDYSAGLLGAYTIKVAVAKTKISFGTGIASGILCNILVCAAVLMAMCAKDIEGKILTSFFVILAFVTSGFEHCVANMYYISAGLLCKLNPEYVSVAKEAYSLTDADLSALSLKGFLFNNLVPVTIGNVIGGALLFAIPLYLVYKNRNNSIPAAKTELKGENKNDYYVNSNFTGTSN